MLRDWVTLCSAAGINVRNLEPMAVYELAGKIINDATLTRIVLGEEEVERASGVISMGSRVRALLDAEPADLAALRNRVGAK